MFSLWVEVELMSLEEDVMKRVSLGEDVMKRMSLGEDMVKRMSLGGGERMSFGKQTEKRI